MSRRLEQFLAEQDLDGAAGLAFSDPEITVGEAAQILRSLSEDDDPLARRNLLLHPEMVPREALASALLAGLDALDGTIVLAAIVGSHRAASILGEPDREAVTDRLLALLVQATSSVTRGRVSAALIVLASPSVTQSLVEHLVDDDPVVRHNVRAALVRSLGAQGAHIAATEAERSGDLPASAARFVDQGVDQGMASNHQLIMRGVLAPHLVPLPDMAVQHGNSL